MKKFKEKSLELIWHEVGSAKFRCGLSSIIGKDYNMYQSWQKRLLEIEDEIIKFNETGKWCRLPETSVSGKHNTGEERSSKDINSELPNTPKSSPVQNPKFMCPKCKTTYIEIVQKKCTCKEPNLLSYNPNVCGRCGGAL